MIIALITLGYCFGAGISYGVCRHFSNDDDICIPSTIFWPAATCIFLGVMIAGIPFIIKNRIDNRKRKIESKIPAELPEHLDNTNDYRKAKLLVENYEKKLPINER